MDLILIFLAIAIVIIAMAFLLSRVFRKTIQKDKQLDDPNANRRDGDATATWIGIDKADGDH
ncbi:MAG: hypothetical protein AAGA76_00935 [Pseudomonadota bacterium]